MRRFVALSVAAALCATSVPASAFLAGNRLLSNYQDPEVKLSAAGYILGVHDTLDGIFFCSPDNATPVQIVDVAIKYLKDNPAKRNKASNLLVVDALKDAWPCPKK